MLLEIVVQIYTCALHVPPQSLNVVNSIISTLNALGENQIITLLVAISKVIRTVEIVVLVYSLGSFHSHLTTLRITMFQEWGSPTPLLLHGNYKSYLRKRNLSELVSPKESQIIVMLSAVIHFS